MPDGGDSFLYIIESTAPVTLPDFGLLGRHAVVDPTVLTTPNKFQLVGIVNAATINKWREGGVKDNYAVTSAEASALNGNSSAYWGFTPP